jgi:1-acyl-sn-glycerol-3-phosphate acyltransferase
MISIEHIKKLKLVSAPKMQELLGRFFLYPNYSIFSKVDISIHGIENIPKDKNVIFAMNHTDRYNYWPFQYKLWSTKQFPFTTVWVKEKYYKNAILGKILDLCNLIPVPSMKYIIEESFAKKFGRRIQAEEYTAIKDAIQNKVNAGKALAEKGSEAALQFYESFVEYIGTHYKTFMQTVARLSREAVLKKNLNIIIFPEGTRGQKLGQGKTGMAQLAINTNTPIVPVGCNNSDKIYSGNLPFAGKGSILYRVGEMLSFEGKLKEYSINEKFQLFSDESKIKYKERFEALTGVVMENINNLIDTQYKK